MRGGILIKMTFLLLSEGIKNEDDESAETRAGKGFQRALKKSDRVYNQTFLLCEWVSKYREQKFPTQY